ncbi:universal stress protein [Streptomyces sp. NPDC050085]|uniref:universal stress protein n=1 Tax=Streptomyces sp. NPDC050085 TaxID=3365600 RepID=UPI0037A7CFEB
MQEPGKPGVSIMAMVDRRVVVGVDGSIRADAAAQWAADEAYRQAAILRVVQVGPAGAGNQSSRAARNLRARYPGLVVEAVHGSGSPAPVLLEQARGSALLVLGVRGVGGHTAPALGAVAREAADRSPGPVVLVPSGLWSGGARRADRVAVGVGPSQLPHHALEFAFERARSRQTRLRAVRAWRAAVPTGPPPPLAQRRATWEGHEAQSLSDALRPWQEKYPQVRVWEDVVLLAPDRALLAASERAELLVVGRHHHGLGPLLLSLVGQAHGAVAVVPD